METNETFSVSATVSSTSSIRNIQATGGTGTITNDDAYAAALTINNARAAEGNQMTFTVTLDKAVSGGLTVTPTYTNGTGDGKASATDYTENTTAINFTGTADETQTFFVATLADEDVEPDETFTVGLTASGTSHSIDTSDTGTGTIRNDDWNQTLSITNASAAEGDAITFTLTLTNAVSGGFSVNPTFTDGTATGKSGTGKDFQRRIKINGTYASVVTFAGTAGETQTFTVGTKEDEVVEGDETFSVSGRVTGANGVDVGTGTGTITNDDNATVTLTKSWRSLIYEGDRGNVTATLDKAVQGGFTTTVKHGKGTNHGTAKNGTDYSTTTTTLTFAGTANEQKTIPISTIEDDVVELHETITIWLDSADKPEDVTLGSLASAIGNDDIPTLTVKDASADEGESMTFTVKLDKDVTAADTDGFTVTPTYTNGTAADADYTKNTNTLDFTGNANESHTFTVSTTEDANAEANETFTVGLTLSGMDQDKTLYQQMVTGTGTGTITDDDRINLSINDASADEGNQMTFTVTLNQDVSGGFTATPSYTNGTTASTDYTENTTGISFTGTKGETKTFKVSTTADTDVEADETFTVGLTVSGTTSTINAETGTGTINNDDSATVTINDASASEGDDMTFTVTLDKAVPNGLKVTPSFTDGTAIEGTDYDENTTALTFTGTANETKTFTVSTTQETDVEANETFTVDLTASDTTYDVIATDTGTGTINNDDSNAITLSVSPSSVAEGAAATEVTVTASTSGGATFPAAKAITVAVGKSG